jgi:hypothetical protein
VASSDDRIVTEPPVAGNDVDTLVGSLERQRRTVFWKCAGLDAAGMRATVGASSMTLGGLLKHLALVEDDYFQRRLRGRSPGIPWEVVDWNADPQWEWRTGAEDPPDEVMALWEGSVSRSRAALREAIANGARSAGKRLLARWPNAQPSPDPHRPHRGVCASRGPRGPHP